MFRIVSGMKIHVVHPLPSITEKDVALITYGDLLITEEHSPLTGLAEFLDERARVSEVINILHILPFFPYSSDRGFSITDFWTVNPKLGSWEDIEGMTEKYRMMFDGVFNHISAESRAFREMLNGTPTFKDIAIVFHSPDELTPEQRRMLVRPRTSDILTKYYSIDGPIWVWTTFSPDQIDLNFKNPFVLAWVVHTLLLYVRKGANLVRLDAVTYLWSEPGTSSANLEQTHEIIKLLRDVLDIGAPNVALVTETNVPHEENISYFGNGYDEAQMVYNFTLPPLVLHTFYSEDATKLSEWAAALGITLGLAAIDAPVIAQEQQVTVAAAAVMLHHASVTGLVTEAGIQDSLEVGREGMVVLDQTPFYAESGGQIGDQGWLRNDQGAEFQVRDTRKQGDSIVHIGELQVGSLKEGDTLLAAVDKSRRQATVLNHSATHLMHAALRQVLGDHVQQKGSLVTPERLRFDFSHSEPMTAEQVAQIESIVNSQVRDNAAADIAEMSMDEALESGAMALFGEKYGAQVRVVNIGFSTELCGGVHVQRAGDVGLFKILSESGIAAGVRRIEAVTGKAALVWLAEQQQRLQSIAQLVKSDVSNAETKISQLVEHERTLEKELNKLKGKLASQAGDDLSSQVVEVEGISVLAAMMDGVDPKSLRETVDKLKDKLGSAAVVLATVSGEKISLVAGVTKDESKRLKAGELVNFVAQQVGGKGGGRPDMAQAGGNQPDHLPKALESVPSWVKDKLNI
jgi:Ser-tRNA(Ala) deacylase AlaX